MASDGDFYAAVDNGLRGPRFATSCAVDTTSGRSCRGYPRSGPWGAKPDARGDRHDDLIVTGATSYGAK
jgi:hypothetical protein